MISLVGFWQISTSIPENINKGKSSAYYPDTSEQPVDKLHSLILSIAGPKAGTIIKTMNNSLKKDEDSGNILSIPPLEVVKK